VKAEKTRIDCEKTRLYTEVHIPDMIPAPALLICHGMNSQGFRFLENYHFLAKTPAKMASLPCSLIFAVSARGKANSTVEVGKQQDVRCALNYSMS
jgi:hypothetical protein